jgi:hypothetical protein
MLQPHSFAEVPLLAAEVPYFRIPRDDWELMLVRARQLGANTICSYVPWCWHEPLPGTLDLAGKSDARRDVVGFVRLCGRLGLRVILKPGPFVDAELLGGGIPPWLLHAHPEIHALRPDGQPWRHSDSGLPRACYLHPTYLDAARRWIGAFAAALRDMQAPDGPVAAVQVDNETPGDGMLPADIGLDPRFRLDYNPHVVEVLWPAWVQAEEEKRRAEEEEPAVSSSALLLFSSSRPLPRTWDEPRTLDQLRSYTQLEAFADWYHAEALATVAGWLRDDGWHVPLFHDLLGAPWEAGGTIADAPGLARVTGWLGHNVYAEDVRAPFVGGGGYRLSFEEYVHFAHWRTRLAAALSPGYPAFIAEISAAQDFFFGAPLLGGAQAMNVYVLTQTRPDEPRAGAFPRWAMEAPVRGDGSVRPRFWNAKTLFTLLGAAGEDFAGARSPAAVAIGYSHLPERAGTWGYQQDYLNRGRAWTPDTPELAAAMAGADHATRGQLLAQELLRAGVSFDVLDLDAATPAELERFQMLVVPACGIMTAATQQKLRACKKLALVGTTRTVYDDMLRPHAELDDEPQRLPEDVDGATIAELVEQEGGLARHAWADAPDVDVAVRYGEHNVYVVIANRRSAPYGGTVAYRAPNGEVLHLQVSLGALRVGLVMMRGDEVLGAAMGGDGSEGGWLARGMFSSIVFSAGAGSAAPLGAGFALTAAQSGRFQLRRRDGWGESVAYRLLLGGELLPAVVQFEAAHASVPYVAEDERGRTDMVLLLPAGEHMPRRLHEYLSTLLLARAAMLRRLTGDDSLGDTAVFAEAAAELEGLAGRTFTLEEYGVAWAASEEACGPAIEALARQLAAIRGAYLAGARDEQEYRAQEQLLAWALDLAARARLANDRE